MTTLLPSNTNYGTVRDILNAALELLDSVNADVDQLSVQISTELGLAVDYVEGIMSQVVGPGKNLVNPADATEGVRLNTSTGEAISDANYWLTGYIRVEEGQDYTLSNPGGYLYYDGSQTFVSGTNVSGHATTTVTIPAGVAYLRCNVHKDNWATFQVEKGDVKTAYEPWELVLQPTLVEPLTEDVIDAVNSNLAVSPAQTTFAVPTKNLYNPDDPDVMPGYTLSGATPVVSANYTTTGFIPVEPGEKYTLSNPRSWSQYDAGKNGITGTAGADSGQGTQTLTMHAQARYLRASYHTANYGATFQVEKGESATEYVPYGFTLPKLITSGGGSDGPPLTLTRSGQGITITDRVAGKTLTMACAITTPSRLNGNFNFGTITFDGTTLTTASDDVTPIRTQLGTVGANHGYPYVRAFTNPDSKDTGDLGSVWTDGDREYVLLAIDGDGKLIIGGSYTYDVDGSVLAPLVSPAGNLTHVSGATHTGTINAATVASAQLYPTATRVNTTVWVDGRRVDADGTYTGYEVQVRECYEVAAYDAIYDGAKANVGTSFADLDLAGSVLFENVYTWRGHGVILVSTDLTELQPTILSACGFVQAARLAPAGTIRNVPGVGEINGNDWSAGVDLDSYSDNTVVTSADLLVPGRPPILAVDRVISGGNTVCGFALGYFPNAGAVTDSDARVASTPANLWDLRGTDKDYPTAVDNVAAGWGHLKARAYRVYLSAQDADEVASRTDAYAAWSALNARARLT